MHYPIVMVTPAIKDALLGPKPHVLHELRYSLHRTSPQGSDKTERTCKAYVCDAATIWQLRGSSVTFKPTQHFTRLQSWGGSVLDPHPPMGKGDVVLGRTSFFL